MADVGGGEKADGDADDVEGGSAEDVEIDVEAAEGEPPLEGRRDPDGDDADDGGGVLGWLLRLFVGLLELLLGVEVRRLRRRAERVERRGRRLLALAGVFLALASLAALVWLLVGVVWLAENTSLSGDVVYFALGGLTGYVLALAAGYVYG
ncbi:MAG: hypothetical protein ACLFMT_02175 [Halobacteriales archaeon]